MSMRLSELTGRQKAAILLIALGPDVSARVFKHLREDEIEDLTLEIAAMQRVEPEHKDAVMVEFQELCLASEYISKVESSMRRSLEKALGSDRAHEVIARLTASLQVRPFDLLAKRPESAAGSFKTNIRKQLH